MSDVVRDYGSPLGELAACLQHVGVVRRSDLGALVANGSPGSVELVTAQLLGEALPRGAYVRRAAAHWGRPDADTLLFAGHPGLLARTVDVIGTLRRRLPSAALELNPRPLTAVGVVGPAIGSLLAGLDLLEAGLGEPRTAQPCYRAEVAGCSTIWFLETEVSAVGIVEVAHLEAVERRIGEAGRPLGLARVGHDAFVRFQLLARRWPAAAR